jgi:hypothetical protein
VSGDTTLLLLQQEASLLKHLNTKSEADKTEYKRRQAIVRRETKNIEKSQTRNK